MPKQNKKTCTTCNYYNQKAKSCKASLGVVFKHPNTPQYFKCNLYQKVNTKNKIPSIVA